MGVRGSEELLAVVPPAAASSAAAVLAGLRELAELRHAPLDGGQVAALAELWERLTAQVASGRLSVLAAVDGRVDVVQRCRPGESGAVFTEQVLGQSRVQARRDAVSAQLLRPEGGDLPRVGAALAAGDITPGHVEVAVRTHRRLGRDARDKIVDLAGVTDPAGRVDPTEPSRSSGAPHSSGSSGSSGSWVVSGMQDVGGALAEAVGELRSSAAAAFAVRVRQVLVVDAVLAHYARRFSVAELDAVARRIVELLNPTETGGGHERRFLYMSQTFEGGWAGRFECGPVQGAWLKTALAAGAAPRPGLTVDGDGVEHVIPDLRDHGARQMDALMDLVSAALAKRAVPPPAPVDGTADGASSATAPTASDGAPASTSTPDGAGVPAPSPSTTAGNSFPFAGAAGEKPEPEGRPVVIREPGVLVGPYPAVDLVLIAGIEHVAAAWARQHDGHGGHGEGLPLDLAAETERSWCAWSRDRFQQRPPRNEQSPPGGDEPPPTPRRASGASAGTDTSGASAGTETSDTGGSDTGGGTGGRQKEGQVGGLVARLARALTPVAAPARVEHVGPVDPATVELLTCSALVRAVLLAPHGAVLDLGRGARLASPSQKLALLARDGGCVVPGCTVPGDACDVHHPTPWSAGGPTDVDNLALACPRHHAETHLGIWEITCDGVPWVRPPAWIDADRPLLRNAVHHPTGRQQQGHPGRE